MEFHYKFRVGVCCIRHIKIARKYIYARCTHAIFIWTCVLLLQFNNTEYLFSFCEFHSFIYLLCYFIFFVCCSQSIGQYIIYFYLVFCASLSHPSEWMATNSDQCRQSVRPVLLNLSFFAVRSFVRLLNILVQQQILVHRWFKTQDSLSFLCICYFYHLICLCRATLESSSHTFLFLLFSFNFQLHAYF